MSRQTDDIHWYGEKIPESVTLRDFFAAAIIQGLMASQCEVTDDPYPIYAYKIADEMIKARGGKP